MPTKAEKIKEIKRKLELLRAKDDKRSKTDPPPRYDEIYFDGLDWLDTL